MKEVIAMHGWSGDSHEWNLWSQLFQANGWHWKSCERGYGELNPFNPIWPKQFSKDESQQRVFIGHSLGPHLIDKKVLSNATHVVLLASFGEFIPKGTTSRPLKTALKQMEARLGTKDEEEMLKTFLEKACEPMPSSAVIPGPIQKGLSIEGRETLKADLQLLIKTNGLPNGFPNKAKVLVVEDQQDAIVTSESKTSLLKELRQHLRDEPTHWILNGTGHALLEPRLIQRVHKWIMEKQ